MMKSFLLILLISLILISQAGCSTNSSSPVALPDSLNDLSEFVSGSNPDGTTHSFLGSWSLSFDVYNSTSSIEPDRDLNAHYNITSMIPAPIIAINSWDPVEKVIDVDVTIHNPYFIDVYDLRLIIFTDNAGHMLNNADGWTSLYDIPSGLIANPFRAYAKYEPNRRFSGNSYNTENLKIVCPGNNFNVQIAVDASFPGNCEEPYEICNFTQNGLYDFPGSRAMSQVTVLDWQDDTNSVKLYCPQITDSTLLPFSQIDPQTWELEIVNNTGVSAGRYTGFILAESTGSGSLMLYNEVYITVTDSTNLPVNPKIAGQIYNMAHCRNFARQDDYLYAACNEEGFKIFDITQPSAPTIITSIELDSVRDVAVYGDYACTTSWYGEIRIYDITNPYNPLEIIYSDAIPAYKVEMNDIYIYALEDFKLHIIDISDPYNPVAIDNTLEIGTMYDVVVRDNLLYFACEDFTGSYFKIVDVSDPGYPVVTDSMELPGVYSVDIDGDFACVTYHSSYQGKLYMLNISDPYEIELLGDADINYIQDIALHGSYAYIVCYNSIGFDYLKVVDLSVPENPAVTGSIETIDPKAIEVQDGYAFIAKHEYGLSVADISNPSAPEIEFTYKLSNSQALVLDGDFVYIAFRDGGLIIADISEPENPRIAGQFFDFWMIDIMGVAVSGSYAYVLSNGTLIILDVSDPSHPEMTGSIDVGVSWNVVVKDNYAYVAAEYDGLRVIDISDPANPEEISYNLFVTPHDLVIDGNYIYLTAIDGSSLAVVDVSDPSDPQKVGYCNAYHPRGIAKQGDYVYIGSYQSRLLQIIDVSNPESPYEVSMAFTDHIASEVSVQDDFAYVAGFESAGGGGLEVVNIDDPANPYLFSSLVTDGHASGIKARENYAYLADIDGGVKIIQLW